MTPKHRAHPRVKDRTAPGADPRALPVVAARPQPDPAETDLHDDYRAQLRVLQTELTRMQRHIIRSGSKVVVLLEGRDASGKDGAIKRIIKYLSPRDTRVVALAKPSDSERAQWYFQRHVAQLPTAAEIVLLNRSWYNRAGVEPVMGFCSHGEHELFLQSVPGFEDMLVQAGFTLLKFYLDISKEEQMRRLTDRKHNPLKQWKNSPVDAVALKHWKAYSAARDTMLLRTHTPAAPWHIVRTDDKRLARLHLIRDILAWVDYPDKSDALLLPDRDIAFEFTLDCIGTDRLARRTMHSPVLPGRHRMAGSAGKADVALADWHLMMEAVRHRLQASVDPALNPPPEVRADVLDCVVALEQLQNLLSEFCADRAAGRRNTKRVDAT